MLVKELLTLTANVDHRMRAASVDPPASLDTVRRVAASIISDPAGFDHIPSDALALVSKPAKHLRNILALEPTSVSQEQLIAPLIDETAAIFLEAVDSVLGRSLGAISEDLGEQRRALQEVAGAYGTEADHSGRTMAICYSLALLVALAVFLGAITWAMSAAGMAGTHLTAFTIIAIGALIVSVYLIHEAGQHRKAAHESRRLQIQFQAFEAYVAPLPTYARSLLRGVMLPRLFPRLLEDDDPLREPVWPDPKDFLRAVAPRVFRTESETEYEGGAARGATSEEGDVPSQEGSTS